MLIYKAPPLRSRVYVKQVNISISLKPPRSFKSYQEQRRINLKENISLMGPIGEHLYIFRHPMTGVLSSFTIEINY